MIPYRKYTWQNTESYIHLLLYIKNALSFQNGRL